jgi:hypothetical protein
LVAEEAADAPLDPDPVTAGLEEHAGGSAALAVGAEGLASLAHAATLMASRSAMARKQIAAQSGTMAFPRHRWRST